MRGPHLYDAHFRRIATVRGLALYDADNNRVVTIHGRELHDLDDRVIAVVRGSDIYDFSSAKIGSMSDVRESIKGAADELIQVAMWYCFVR